MARSSPAAASPRLTVAGLPLEALGRDRVVHADQRGQRLVLGRDRGRALPGRLQRLAQHPGHGVAVEHDLGREQRLVVLLPGVVEPGHVGGGQHPDHAGHGYGGVGAQRDQPGVRVRRRDRPGVQQAERPADQVLGVEGGAGDVQVGALMRYVQAHRGLGRPVGQRPETLTHVGTSSCSACSAWNLSSELRSIAVR